MKSKVEVESKVEADHASFPPRPRLTTLNMRRFSQRNSLVTLSDINITPLLDLAFVLLIIFVITTPLLEQSINLKLPQGGKPDTPMEKKDIRTVEISPQGIYTLDRRRMTLDQMETELVRAYRANPNTIVYIRADENGLNKNFFALNFSLATATPTINSSPKHPKTPKKTGKKKSKRLGSPALAAVRDFCGWGGFRPEKKRGKKLVK